MFVITNAFVIISSILNIYSEMFYMMVFFGIFIILLIIKIIELFKPYIKNKNKLITDTKSYISNRTLKLKNNFKQNKSSSIVNLILNVVIVFIILGLSIHFGKFSREHDFFGFSDMGTHLY